MNPIYAQLILFGLEEFIKYVPVISEHIAQMILNKQATDPAEWNALRNRVATKYSTIVPNSQLSEDTIPH